MIPPYCVFQIITYFLLNDKLLLTAYGHLAEINKKKKKKAKQLANKMLKKNPLR